MADLLTAGTTAAGAGGTLALRQQLDQTGSTALTRPSVLYGVGLGGLMLGAGMAVDRGMFAVPVGTRNEFVTATTGFGAGALSAGVVSAFLPKGTGGVQVPSLA